MLHQDVLDQYFPQVKLGVKVLGGGILIQGKHIPTTTESGIILTDDTKEVASYDVKIGKVVAMGPLAFKNKATGEDWNEGAWCQIGDIVAIPRSGTRYTRNINGEEFHFVLVNDTDPKVIFEDLDGFNIDKI